jgi:hypothetical protein
MAKGRTAGEREIIEPEELDEEKKAALMLFAMCMPMMRCPESGAVSA